MEITPAFVVLALTVLSVHSGPIADDHDHHRSKREVPAGKKDPAQISPRDRPACVNGGPNNSTTVTVTTARLAALRTKMVALGVDAYIVSTEDEHQSEFISPHDERRTYITGFTGSAGVAVITKNQSALWTDGRYFLQAEQQLDCNWILMKHGQTDVPSRTEWLKAVLKSGDKVGADPKLIPNGDWKDYADKLSKSGITMVKDNNNLIDQIWTTGRPAEKNNKLLVMNMTYTGRSWENKWQDVMAKLQEQDADTLIITTLDEVAWMCNLRGSDIDYNPVFFGYVILQKDSIRLYIKDKATRLTQEVQNHLKVKADGTCKGAPNTCIQVKDYNSAIPDIKTTGQSASKVWVSPHSSFAVYDSINKTKVYDESSPILLLKAEKNHVERDGLKECHIRDAMALIKFLAFLEKEIEAGKKWDEISAATKLEEYRRNTPLNHGLSFNTISGFGSNGAVIHYMATPATNKTITKDSMYLLDSGGQYLDGTTDVTRSMHYGTPKEEHMQAYTRVLMGSIDLATIVWPKGVYGRDIDVVARRHLWEYGWQYNHGTGHGIGAFLNVHEGPASISIGYSAAEQPLYEGMFLSDGPASISYWSRYKLLKKYGHALTESMFMSDEPGYYEDGEFGVRLETIVMVTNASTKYNFDGKVYLTFEPITLVPFEPKLIKYDLLSIKQKEWLNMYNKMCMEKVGSRLKDSNPDAYKWMEARCKHIQVNPTGPASAANKQHLSIVLLVIVSVLVRLMKY